jgi:hypothetical protein
MPMRSRKTAEEEYRLLAIQSRALADWEINPFEKRQLLLAAQRYDILADRSKRAAELRSRKKSA